MNVAKLNAASEYFVLAIFMSSILRCNVKEKL
jgi:hypothetical protein